MLGRAVLTFLTHLLREFCGKSAKCNGAARSFWHRLVSLGESKHMTYTADIARTNPTAFLFVVDQSASMDERLESGQTKAEFVADVLNKTLYQLVIRCTRSEGVRNYFDVGVIGYGGKGVYSAFGRRWLQSLFTHWRRSSKARCASRRAQKGCPMARVVLSIKA